MGDLRQVFRARFGGCWVVQEAPFAARGAILVVPEVRDGSEDGCWTVPKVTSASSRSRRS